MTWPGIEPIGEHSTHLVNGLVLYYIMLYYI